MAHLGQKKSSSAPSLVFYALSGLCLALGPVATWLVLFVAPVPANMDLSQKIFYFHVPSAISMYLAVGTCSLASLVYLLKGSDKWDCLGRAGAEVGTAFCLVVLISGPIWAIRAWGAPWVWDPRLTSVAALGLILAAYHLVRVVGEQNEAARRLAAALGLLAAPNGVLIHLAVRMWGGQHPTVIYEEGSLDPTIRDTFILCIVTIVLSCILLVWWRAQIEMGRRKVEALKTWALLQREDEPR